jgi:putative FmdB family regulatory protein
MPLYEFACKACGKRFEVLVRLGQEKSVCCEACGSKDLEKLFSPFGIGGGGSRIKTSSASCSSCSSKSCATCK